jgi:hypothetical protein
MGATSIKYTVRQSEYESPQAAYRAMVEEAEYNYGHDPYNGTISTCEFRGRIARPCNSAEYEEALDNIHKRDVYYYEDGHTWVFIGWAAC